MFSIIKRNVTFKNAAQVGMGAFLMHNPVAVIGFMACAAGYEAVAVRDAKKGGE